MNQTTLRQDLQQTLGKTVGVGQASAFNPTTLFTAIPGMKPDQLQQQYQQHQQQQQQQSQQGGNQSIQQQQQLNQQSQNQQQQQQGQTQGQQTQNQQSSQQNTQQQRFAPISTDNLFPQNQQHPSLSLNSMAALQQVGNFGGLTPASLQNTLSNLNNFGNLNNLNNLSGLPMNMGMNMGVGMNVNVGMNANANSAMNGANGVAANFPNLNVNVNGGASNNVNVNNAAAFLSQQMPMASALVANGGASDNGANGNGAADAASATASASTNANSGGSTNATSAAATNAQALGNSLNASLGLFQQQQQHGSSQLSQPPTKKRRIDTTTDTSLLPTHHTSLLEAASILPTAIKGLSAPTISSSNGSAATNNDANTTASNQSARSNSKAKAKHGEKPLKPIPPSKVGISEYNDNDVLSGRGGGTNVHSGNRTFRDLINMHRRNYLKARKNDKPAISRAIVRTIRENNGRFLKKDEKTGLWFEIGDDAAREKTSQALRQRAPEMRKLLFDTEQEEARAAVADQQLIRQRMLSGGMPGSFIGQNVLNADAQAMMNMNPMLLQAMANKGLGSAAAGNDFSQMLNAALLQNGINRFTPNGA